MMERWNKEMFGPGLVVHPLFHDSSIPSFQRMSGVTQ
jgi:hypothetical protein